MKNIFFIALLATSTSVVSANPTVMAGISYNFGSRDLGLTIKVLSNDEGKEVVGAVGATYYPASKENVFGIDAGIGYTFDADAAVVVSWDFLRKDSQVSIGYADIDDDSAPVVTEISDPVTETETDPVTVTETDAVARLSL